MHAQPIATAGRSAENFLLTTFPGYRAFTKWWSVHGNQPQADADLARSERGLQ